MSLSQHLGTTCFEPLRESAGVKLAAEILRAAEGGGTSILEDLKEGQPELAEEIGKHLLVFEDLAMFDDRALQVLLKEVDTQRLALALKNAPDALQARLLDNLSRRAAEMVREEMDLLGPVRFVDVEAARRSILETVLLLESSGRLYISGRGREENRIVY
jgi:flagellar motor switch protein FliG